MMSRKLLVCGVVLRFLLYHTFTPLLLHFFHHYLITLIQGHMAIHVVAL